MTDDLLHETVIGVLHHYRGDLHHSVPGALGNQGGFSGASLWRVTGANVDLCLRGWPPGDPSPERLHFIHGLMKTGRGAGLEFVPELQATQTGATWVEHAGRLWEITTWMGGRADFRERPTMGRLQSVCSALARLHVCWARVTAFPPDVCPGVRRRVERVAEWNALVGSAWRPELSPADPVSPWAERAWHHVSWQITEIPRQLAAWINRAVPLQPCLADVWHNHVLFEGERLTGIVDYGGVKIDHVAVDLARLLGSLVGDDRQMWAAGLAAYRRVRPLSAEEEALAFALDRTGIVIGAANWLRWLYRDRHAFADREAVARRLAELAGRMERWDQE